MSTIGMIELIFSAIASVLGGSGLWVAIAGRKRRKAEAEYLSSKAVVNYQHLSDEWIQRLRERIHELEFEVSRLQKTVADTATYYENKIRGMCDDCSKP